MVKCSKCGFSKRTARTKCSRCNRNGRRLDTRKPYRLEHFTKEDQRRILGSMRVKRGQSPTYLKLLLGKLIQAFARKHRLPASCPINRARHALITHAILDKIRPSSQRTRRSRSKSVARRRTRSRSGSVARRRSRSRSVLSSGRRRGRKRSRSVGNRRSRSISINRGRLGRSVSVGRRTMSRNASSDSKYMYPV